MNSPSDLDQASLDAEGRGNTGRVLRTEPSPFGSSPSVSPASAVSVSRAGDWSPRQAKYDWRSFLTAEEIATLAAADAAKAEWLRLNAGRAAILNRAIQRAKHAANRGGKA